MRSKACAAVALAIVAIGAGCGATHSGGGGDTAATPRTGRSARHTTATTRAQAVKFAECMRANGVRAFPDPDASGALTIDAVANGSSVDTSSAAFERAVSACKALEPPGFTGRRRSPEQQKVALEFARCMRGNGVPDFPDPTPDGPIIDTSRMPGSPGAHSIPGFQAAIEQCSDLYSGRLGVKGP